MRLAYWYVSTFFVVIFLIYLTAVKYVRGVEIDYNSYYDYRRMTAFLHNISFTHPELTQLKSIGKSVQGRDLWVLIISKNPTEEPLLKPNVKYVANMHGNEAIGRQLMLYLIVHLINNYRTDAYVKYLLDNTRIHVMPSMNPDGFESAVEGQCNGGQGRYNVRGFDLNRNFPDYFKTNNKAQQPETKAIRDWIDDVQFALSANLHGGALVASYPFDNAPNSILSAFTPYSSPSQTPDDDVFKHLASVYSFNHLTMHLGQPCKDGSNTAFPNGTTNGAAWYPLIGGMQDYNYVWGGTMEITLELSCCKYPYRGELPRFWRENRKALLVYLGEVHRGVRGVISDVNNNPVSAATLKIKGRDITFKTSKRGEFWRILLPGNYAIEVLAEGYQPLEKQFTVHEGEATFLPLQLLPTGFHQSQSASLTGQPNYGPSSILTQSSSSNRPLSAVNQLVSAIKHPSSIIYPSVERHNETPIVFPNSLPIHNSPHLTSWSNSWPIRRGTSGIPSPTQQYFWASPPFTNLFSQLSTRLNSWSSTIG